MAKTHTERFIGYLMKHGARARAERIFQSALEQAHRKIRGAAPSETILNIAINNAQPSVALKRQHIGGFLYHIPTPVSEKRSVSLAIRTIIEVASTMKGRTMPSRLAKALIAAYRNQLDKYLA